MASIFKKDFRHVICRDDKSSVYNLNQQLWQWWLVVVSRWHTVILFEFEWSVVLPSAGDADGLELVAICHCVSEKGEEAWYTAQPELHVHVVPADPELMVLRTVHYPRSVSPRRLETFKTEQRPSKHEPLKQCWFDVGPASASTSNQHWFNVWCSLGFYNKTTWLIPLTAGAVHIRFLHFILAHYISASKHIKDKKWQ